VYAAAAGGAEPAKGFFMKRRYFKRGIAGLLGAAFIFAGCTMGNKDPVYPGGWFVITNVDKSILSNPYSAEIYPVGSMRSDYRDKTGIVARTAWSTDVNFLGKPEDPVNTYRMHLRSAPLFNDDWDDSGTYDVYITYGMYGGDIYRKKMFLFHPAGLW
jgi:hypothetical protein